MGYCAAFTNSTAHMRHLRLVVRVSLPRMRGEPLRDRTARMVTLSVVTTVTTPARMRVGQVEADHKVFTNG